MGQINKMLLLVSVLLLVVNIWGILNFDLETSRWLRLFSSGVFLSLFLWKSSAKNKWLNSAFILLFISDIFLLNYESSIFRSLTFIAGILAYTFLFLRILPKIKNLKSSLTQRIIFGFIFLLNAGLLLFLVDMIPQELEFNNPLENLLFLLYGLAIITLVIAAISYSNRHANAPSFYFTIAVFGLAFSDITSFIAYFLQFPEFFYPDRVLYILGLAALVRYTGLKKKKMEFI
jgi:hypothetical protein